MGYALRHGEFSYPMGEERFIIGRSEGCHLCLDDPMASRSHVALQVEEGRLLLEDLKSRNGVYVNEKRVTCPRALSHGDVIRVGGAQMTILRRGEHKGAETLIQKPITEGSQAFGVLGTLTDKALALGHGEEAERILGRQLEQILQKSESQGALDAEELDRCVHYALGIGTLTQKGKWIDYLFRIHTAHQRIMSADLVNSLYSMASKSGGSKPAHLRIYLEALRLETASFDPGERFVLKRIEGLEALLS